MSHIDELTTIIQKLHGATAKHRQSVPVKDAFEGKTVWEGIVEVFHLDGHPTTSKVYAWMHDDGKGKPPRHVTVSHVPPAVSPVTAVRAFIVQEFRNAPEQA